MKIAYSFTNAPLLGDPLDEIASYKNANSTLMNTFKWAVTHIGSVINIQSTQSTAPDWTVHLASFNHDYGGYTYWGNGDADIYIRPSDAGNKGLMLHEIGHALTLEHNNIPESIMRPTLTSAQLSTYSAIPNYDLIRLNGLYGASPSYTGDWSGTSFNDTIYGGTGVVDPRDVPQSIFGMGGSDVLYGNGGNDTIYGGSGTADPADKADTIYGGAGANIIYGNGGNDVIYGNSLDTIYGGGGADTVYGAVNWLDYRPDMGDIWVI